MDIRRGLFIATVILISAFSKTILSEESREPRSFPPKVTPQSQDARDEFITPPVTQEKKTAEIPHRVIMPLQYFTPSPLAKVQNSDVEELRQQFTAIAARKAAIMSMEELRAEIAEAEMVLQEMAAREALKSVETTLLQVCHEYPNTEASRTAKQALQMLTKTAQSERNSP